MIGFDRDLGLVAVGVRIVVIIAVRIIGMVVVIPVIPIVVIVAAGSGFIRRLLFTLPRHPLIHHLLVIGLGGLDVGIPGFVLDIFHRQVHQCLQLILGEAAVVFQRLEEQAFILIQPSHLRALHYFRTQRGVADHPQEPLFDHRVQQGADDALEGNLQEEGHLQGG